jgi:hypothetical protein
MNQGRHGIKLLGLSLIAALGLVAFTAAAAQAGEYKIEGKNLTEKGIASESVSGTIAKGSLLVPGLFFTITCTSGAFSGTILLGGVAHASILFSGCEASSVCKPFETKAKMETNLTADKGFIVASGLGELVLMGEKHYLLVSSTGFTTIYWPKLCPLTLETIISGSTVFLAPNALTQLVNQTLSTIPKAELESLFPGETLAYQGAQLGWLDEGGTTSAALTGANVGKTWGGE